MAIKPDPHQTALLQDQIEKLLRDPSASEADKQCAREISEQLEGD